MAHMSVALFVGASAVASEQTTSSFHVVKQVWTDTLQLDDTCELAQTPRRVVVQQWKLWDALAFKGSPLLSETVTLSFSLLVHHLPARHLKVIQAFTLFMTLT